MDAVACTARLHAILLLIPPWYPPYIRMDPSWVQARKEGGRHIRGPYSGQNQFTRTNFIEPSILFHN